MTPANKPETQSLFSIYAPLQSWSLAVNPYPLAVFISKGESSLPQEGLPALLRHAPSASL